MNSSGIRTATQQRCIGLTIEEETHREQARQGIVGVERQFERIVTTAGAAGYRSDIPHDRGLFTQTQIQTEIQVMIKVTTSSPTRLRLSLLCIVIILTVTILITRGSCILPTTTAAEEFEVVDLIGEAQYPVMTARLIDLHTGHREVQHPRRTVLEFTGKVILQGDIYSQQR